MRYFVFTLLLFLSCSASAQTIVIKNSSDLVNSMAYEAEQQLLIAVKDSSGEQKDMSDHLPPFCALNKYNNWAIKGKAMPWFAVYATGMNYSGGLEFGFLKRHSLGIDLYQNTYSFDPPDVYDSVKQSYDGGYRVYFRDRAVSLNYRYYFSPGKAWKYGFHFYAGAFLRYMQRTFTYDEGYIKKDNISSEIHRSAGVFCGFLKETVYIRKIKTPINLDVYLGMYAKEKKLEKEEYDSLQGLTHSYDYPVCCGIKIGFDVSIPLQWKRK